MSEKRVLAFDFGASGGRAMLGIFDGATLQFKEIHRFSNDPVTIGKTVYWDVLRLFHEIKQGMMKAKHDGGFDCIGIDTWGVDFGLLDAKGNLLENPIHYRDERTKGMIEQSFRFIPKERFYQITGNQFMELNTVFQLLSLKLQRPELLDRAKHMLLTPDLFAYFLTGEKHAEYSIASTTQMLDANTGTWSEEVIHRLDIPRHILCDIIPSGTISGYLQDTICEELNLLKIPVVAVASHDTQSAMIAVPAKEEDFIFLSCGTWSLLGTELRTPIVNEKSLRYNITNEGGYQGTTSFLKNIIGLWLIQESRRQWQREGCEYEFSELERMAEKAQPLCSFINPDAVEFGIHGNIPQRIRAFCERTGQKVPCSIGETVRCINESLALKYRKVLEEIEDCTEKKYDVIYMVGGGTQSKLLCQFTADSCNRRVVAGPKEATVLGNMALQLIALGEIKDLQEARKLIASSQDITVYEPQNPVDWNQAYERFCTLF